jgi:hypothetical protein
VNSHVWNAWKKRQPNAAIPNGIECETLAENHSTTFTVGGAMEYRYHGFHRVAIHQFQKQFISYFYRHL